MRKQKKQPVTWKCNEPATLEEITDLNRRTNFKLPEDYLNFLLKSNGGEGDVSVCPGYLIFYSCKEAKIFNQDANENNELNEEFSYGGLNEYFVFGGDGGGEHFVLPLQTCQNKKILLIPMIPFELNEALVLAPDFKTFLECLGEEFDDKFPPHFLESRN